MSSSSSTNDVQLKPFDTRQTKLDRADLRDKYRQLEANHKLKRPLLRDVEGQAKIFAEKGEPGSLIFKSTRELKNLAKRVTRPNEFVVDIHVANFIASDMKDASNQLTAKNKHINRNAIIQGIKKRFALDRSTVANHQDLKGRAIEIDWVKLGRTAGVYFRAPPRWTPMLGKIDTFDNMRKPKKQRVKMHREEPMPKKKQETKENGKMDEQSFQLKLCQDMINVSQAKCLTDPEVSLYKRTGAGAFAERCYFSLVLNRHSFAQTIENIFACAILARDGKLSISVGAKSDLQYQKRKDCGLEDIRGLPCVWCPIGRADAVNVVETSGGRIEQQNIEMIPKIDKAMWERLCKETSFESFMPNRKYPDYYGGDRGGGGGEKEEDDDESSEEEESSEEVESSEEEESSEGEIVEKRLPKTKKKRNGETNTSASKKKKRKT
jgi:hypothetical protein